MEGGPLRCNFESGPSQPGLLYIGSVVLEKIKVNEVHPPSKMTAITKNRKYCKCINLFFRFNAEYAQI
jgi:hypothetical protein